MNDRVEPLVSVIMPTYNQAQYINQAIQSVLDQSYENWELIVIDNYSTDKTDAVIASFSDPRIISKKIHNGGVIAASKNVGIFQAKGEWVAFLDSDDFWAANKLKHCLEHAGNNVDIIYHNMATVDEKSKISRRAKIKSWQVNAPITIDLMVRGNALAASSVMVRSKVLRQVNGMNESNCIVAAEDYNTWLRISQFTDGFKYIPQKLGFYRVHNSGISSTKDMSWPTANAIADFKDLLSPAQLIKIEAEFRYLKGRFNYLRGNFIEAHEHLIYAIQFGKLSIKFKSLFMITRIRIFSSGD